jgi:hypothetical protein
VCREADVSATCGCDQVLGAYETSERAGLPPLAGRTPELL